jgi:hypothetical protein
VKVVKVFPLRFDFGGLDRLSRGLWRKSLHNLQIIYKATSNKALYFYKG